MNRLVCFIRKHRIICTEELVLIPGEEVRIEHTHTCQRCGSVYNFETASMDTALSDMIRNMLEAQNTIRVLSDKRPLIH